MKAAKPLVMASLWMPGKLPSWNQWYGNKVHWSERTRLKTKWVVLVNQAASRGRMQHRKMATAPVLIVVTQHLVSRKVDPDNLATKLVVDGVKYLGLIPDDGPAYVWGVMARVVPGDRDWVQLDIICMDPYKALILESAISMSGLDSPGTSGIVDLSTVAFGSCLETSGKACKEDKGGC